MEVVLWPTCNRCWRAKAPLSLVANRCECDDPCVKCGADFNDRSMNTRYQFAKVDSDGGVIEVIKPLCQPCFATMDDCPHRSHFACVDCSEPFCSSCGRQLAAPTDELKTLGYVCPKCMKQGKYWVDGKDRP